MIIHERWKPRQPSTTVGKCPTQMLGKCYVWFVRWQKIKIECKWNIFEQLLRQKFLLELSKDIFVKFLVMAIKEDSEKIFIV